MGLRRWRSKLRSLKISMLLSPLGFVEVVHNDFDCSTVPTWCMVSNGVDLYGLRLDRDLMVLDGAAWTALTSNGNLTGNGAGNLLALGVDVYLVVTNASGPLNLSFSKYGGAGLWVSQAVLVAYPTLSRISACAVMGSDIYLSIYTALNTNFKIVKYDGTTFTDVTGFYAYTAELSGMSLVVYGGNLYVLSAVGELYLVTGGALVQKTTAALWGPPSIAPQSQFPGPVGVAVNGNLLIPNLANNNGAGMQSGAFFSWDGVSAEFVQVVPAYPPNGIKGALLYQGEYYQIDNTSSYILNWNGGSEMLRVSGGGLGHPRQLLNVGDRAYVLFECGEGETASLMYLVPPPSGIWPLGVS